MKTTLFAGAGFSIAVSLAVKARASNYDSDPMPSAYQMFNNPAARSYLENQYKELREYLKSQNYLNESYEDVYTQTRKDRPELSQSIQEMVYEHLFVNFPPHKDRHRTKIMIDVIRDWLDKNKITDIMTTNPDILLDIAIMGATEFDCDFLRLMKLSESWFKGMADDIGDATILPKREFPIYKLESFSKLHGSVSMLKDKNSSYFYWLNNYNWYPGISSAYVTNEANTNSKRKYVREVIPPISGKIKANGESLLTDEPYKSLYKNAEHIFDNSTRIIFYGFGFSIQDDKVNEWLAVNVRDKKDNQPLKEIVIIDKKIDESFKNKVIKCLKIDKKEAKERIQFIDSGYVIS